MLVFEVKELIVGLAVASCVRTSTAIWRGCKCARVLGFTKDDLQTHQLSVLLPFTSWNISIKTKGTGRQEETTTDFSKMYKLFEIKLIGEAPPGTPALSLFYIAPALLSPVRAASLAF